MDLTKPCFEHAAVVHGDYAQLRQGMRWHFPRIESRMLFWCVSGRGYTLINGRRYPLEPGSFFILPWGSDHIYQADEPMGVGGIHVIPWYDPASPLNCEVAHSSTSAVAGSAARRDVPVPGLEALVTGRLDDHPVLARQADYVVSLFRCAESPIALARALGPILLWQWRESAKRADGSGLPRELATVLNYVQGAQRLNFTLGELCEAGGMSRSTLIRQFKLHLHTTPHRWLADHRLRAAERLLRSTTLRIKQVATQVSIDDPLTFSHWFKQRTGMSPKAFRQHYRGMPRELVDNGH